MSATSTGDEKVKVGLQSVPTLSVQDAEHNANEDIMANSSERGSAQMKLKSGIITEGDSKRRQRSGRNRNSSGKRYSKLQSFCVMIHSGSEKKIPCCFYQYWEKSKLDVICI